MHITKKYKHPRICRPYASRLNLMWYRIAFAPCFIVLLTVVNAHAYRPCHAARQALGHCCTGALNPKVWPKAHVCSCPKCLLIFHLLNLPDTSRHELSAPCAAPGLHRAALAHMYPLHPTASCTIFHISSPHHYLYAPPCPASRLDFHQWRRRERRVSVPLHPKMGTVKEAAQQQSTTTTTC